MKDYVALSFLTFFLQADYGIRDYKVTGVQTCALPISNKKQNSRPGQPTHPAETPVESKPSSTAVTYTYEFTQPDFHVRHVVIQHDSAGRGTITFERSESVV